MKYLFFLLLLSLFSPNSSIPPSACQSLPESIQKDLEKLAVDRIGILPESTMKTHAIVSSVSPQKNYLFTGKTLQETKKIASQKILAELTTTPRHTTLRGSWQTSGEGEENFANILGNSQSFISQDDSIEIPAAQTTKENINYYGARLLESGDVFSFQSNADLPVAAMTIEPNYVDGYLLQEGLGGGAYLERHDRPHFHMPSDSHARGYLILGKKVEKDYQLSAFRIPYGKAIYTDPWVIHSDAYLIGNYAVVYSVTENYSTVLLKNLEGDIIPVRIKEDSKL